MGFFGNAWNFIKKQLPTWEQATSWNYWFPTWEQATSWRYWVSPGAAIGGVILVTVGVVVGYVTGFFSGLWDDLWWWIHYLFAIYGEK
jgi:hypothetical protein